MNASIPADALARRPLLLVALDKGQVVAERRFEPGATVSVGSNSGNDLVIDERFELVQFTLLTAGSTLHVAPPLSLHATVWHAGEPLVLEGFYRMLRDKHPGLPTALPLASERFIVRYGSGVAFLGRFES